MRVTVNGEEKDLEDRLTVDRLLAVLGIEPRGVAVERNKTVIPRSTFATTCLAEGDAIEIVRFVGGG